MARTISVALGRHRPCQQCPETVPPLRSTSRDLFLAVQIRKHGCRADYNRILRRGRGHFSISTQTVRCDERWRRETFPQLSSISRLPCISMDITEHRQLILISSTGIWRRGGCLEGQMMKDAVNTDERPIDMTSRSLRYLNTSFVAVQLLPSGCEHLRTSLSTEINDRNTGSTKLSPCYACDTWSSKYDMIVCKGLGYVQDRLSNARKGTRADFGSFARPQFTTEISLDSDLGTRTITQPRNNKHPYVVTWQKIHLGKYGARLVPSRTSNPGTMQGDDLSWFITGMLGMAKDSLLTSTISHESCVQKV